MLRTASSAAQTQAQRQPETKFRAAKTVHFTTEHIPSPNRKETP
ncbi:hypothetical protein [Kingella bonacorsii]|nr:hypothetical protein [Kingella bonacorsii]